MRPSAGRSFNNLFVITYLKMVNLRPIVKAEMNFYTILLNESKNFYFCKKLKKYASRIFENSVSVI